MLMPVSGPWILKGNYPYFITLQEVSQEVSIL